MLGDTATMGLVKRIHYLRRPASIWIWPCAPLADSAPALRLRSPGARSNLPFGETCSPGDAVHDWAWAGTRLLRAIDKSRLAPSCVNRHSSVRAARGWRRATSKSGNPSCECRPEDSGRLVVGAATMPPVGAIGERFESNERTHHSAMPLAPPIRARADHSFQETAILSVERLRRFRRLGRRQM